MRKLFGDEVARARGGHLGVWGGTGTPQYVVRTAQPGLYFIGGSFAQCRIYSKYLGLQIKACELGRIVPFRSAEEPRACAPSIGAPHYA